MINPTVITRYLTRARFNLVGMSSIDPNTLQTCSRELDRRAYSFLTK